jgi:hypothetical protein
MLVRYVVLIVVLMKSQVIWEMTPCRVLHPYSLFVYATATSYLKAACWFAETFLKGFHWRSFRASSAVVQLSIKSRTHACTILKGSIPNFIKFNIDSLQLQANTAHTYRKFCQSCVLDDDACKVYDAMGNHYYCTEYE